jgi:hypothetical protein
MLADGFGVCLIFYAAILFDRLPWYDLSSAGIKPPVGSGTPGRLQRTPRTKVIKQLPDQVLEPMRL